MASTPTGAVIFYQRQARDAGGRRSAGTDRTEYQFVVVVGVVLIALALVAGAGAVVELWRAPNPNTTPLPEEEHTPMRLRAYWRGALWGAALLPIGLALAAVTRTAAFLLISLLTVMISPMSLGLMYDAKVTGWYMRYQARRLERGLQPRRWWDGRLG